MQYEWWGETCARDVTMNMLQWGALVASLDVYGSPSAIWRTCQEKNMAYLHDWVLLARHFHLYA
jgi:hypothetical protein